MIGRIASLSACALALMACSGPAVEANAANSADVQSDAQAEEAPARASGDAQVDALLAALTAGDEAAARRGIYRVGYMVSQSGIVSTADELIARVSGCTVETLTETRAVMNFRVVWRCQPSGGAPVFYNAALGTRPPLVPAGSGVAVFEFEEGRGSASLDAPRPMPSARGESE